MANLNTHTLLYVGGNGCYDSKIEVKLNLTKLRENKQFIIAKYYFNDRGLLQASWVLSFICTSSGFCGFSNILNFLQHFAFYIITTDSYIKSLNETFRDPDFNLVFSPEAYQKSSLYKLIDNLNIEFIKEEGLKIPELNNPFPLHPCIELTFDIDLLNSSRV